MRLSQRLLEEGGNQPGGMTISAAPKQISAAKAKQNGGTASSQDWGAELETLANLEDLVRYVG